MGARELRIGVDVREWRRDSSTGIARYLTGLLEYAAEQTDHRFLLLGNERTEQRVAAEAVEFFRIPERQRLLWDQSVVPRWLREQRADVFLSPYYKVPLKSPCPSVATIHDLIPIHYPRPGEGGVRRWVTRRWMRLLLGRADRIVTDSEHSRDDLVRTLGLLPGRIDVVPLRLDPAFDGSPAEAEVVRVLARESLEPGYVLYVGRHEPHKNVEVLVRAWESLEPALRASHPLVLAGGGAERFASKDANVRGLGFVPDEDLPALYAGAIVFAFPSRYEGFGLPPLEAMGCGTAVVCSNAASLPEIVGDAAVSVSPDDVGEWTRALRTVITDYGARHRLVEAGRIRAALFRTEQTVPKLVAVLEGAARRGGQPTEERE